MATTPTPPEIADVARQRALQAAAVVERQRDAEEALTGQLRGERYLTTEEAWYLRDLIADLRRAAAAVSRTWPEIKTKAQEVA